MNNLLSILTSDGFEERFEENLRRYRLPKNKVYEITETERENLIGERHYSSYDSFRTSRSKRRRR